MYKPNTMTNYNYKAASPETFPTGNNAVPKLSDRNSPVSVGLRNHALPSEHGHRRWLRVTL